MGEEGIRPPVDSTDRTEAIVHFDGACQPARGGGVATYGFVVEGPGVGREECGLAVRPNSPRATNNVAEYVAAIRALEWLRSRAFRGRVVLMGDSQLVIRQMNGEYAVRAEHLLEYHRWLRSLVEGFPEVRIVWIRREENGRADALSKQALQDHRPPPPRGPGRAGALRGGGVDKAPEAGADP